jgi:hypothetical protein
MHAKKETANVHPIDDRFELMHIDMLTEEECLQVRLVIHDLMRYKTKTRLGAASYKVHPFLSSRMNRYLYLRKARNLNPILKDRFGWLYDRVAKTLAMALEAPTSYPKDLALPGFHIYQRAIREKRSIFPGVFLPGVSFHFDMQWKKIDWGDPDKVNFKLPLSFTLPVALPDGGAGLNVWDIHREECTGLGPAERQQLRLSRTKTYHPYKLGRAVLHSGLQMHQIAPTQDFKPGDERITLQGHGIMRDGVWQLYW